MLYHILFISALVFQFMLGVVQADERRLIVVELFTSQGCSYCPPADAHIGDLAQQQNNILALSFHVDYWDYIGWKDPFSSSDHSVRQKEYNKVFGLRSVYTPQIVVQGSFENTGFDRHTTLRHIERARSLPYIQINLIRNEDNGIIVSLPDKDLEIDAEVFMITFDRKHITQIKHGENKGQELINYNVARAIRKLGNWNGEAVEMHSMPRRWSPEGDVCAVIIQKRKEKQILGAAYIAMDNVL